MPKKMYSFTWSTRDFYVKTPKGKIKRLKTSPKPKSFALRVVRNAPNWVTK